MTVVLSPSHVLHWSVRVSPCTVLPPQLQSFPSLSVVFCVSAVFVYFSSDTVSTWPTHHTRLLTKTPFKLLCSSISFLRSFILLSALFVRVILRIQLFQQIYYWFVTVTRPDTHTSMTHAVNTFPLSLFKFVCPRLFYHISVRLTYVILWISAVFFKDSFILCK